MRLQPPRVTIDETDPFKAALFDRAQFGAALTSLLRNAEESVVLFVHAPWGEGKTTFARMWQASLRQQKLEAVYFDAYASDYFDDPFVSFTGEILQLLEKMEGVEVPRTELKKNAIELGKRLGGIVAKTGLRALTMGAVDAAHLHELKDIANDLVNGVSDAGAELIEKRIESYASEKDALKSFRKSLAAVAKAYRDQYGFPLTIIVDELDRCRPDFALELLERIKHLFDVDGIAFVLLVNRQQIESYVRMVYGEQVDATAYLLKFGNLFVDLPTQPPQMHHAPGRREYTVELFKHFQLSDGTEDSQHLVNNIGIICTHFDLTLREIEKAFVVMALYYGALTKGRFTNEFLVPLLAVLKIKRPQVFVNLREGKLDNAEFFRATDLNRMRLQSGDSLSQEWVSDMLGYCLMTDEEIKKLTADVVPGQRQMTGPLRFADWLGARILLGRKQVIPLLCSQLERFSVAPPK
jgi:hypothetical protein